MATISTTSKITTSADEENRMDYETDLSAKNTDDEIHANTSNWFLHTRKSCSTGLSFKNTGTFSKREPPFRPL